MSKRIRIEVSSGEVMYADFLYEMAPETCRCLENDMPCEKTLSHGKWSGHVLYVFTDMDLKKAECSRTYGVCPGDILYNPHVVDDADHQNELIIVYGPSAIRNVSGFGIANLCGRIDSEYLPVLYKLGIDINRNGQRSVTMAVEEM